MDAIYRSRHYPPEWSEYSNQLSPTFGGLGQKNFRVLEKTSLGKISLFIGLKRSPYPTVRYHNYSQISHMRHLPEILTGLICAERHSDERDQCKWGSAIQLWKALTWDNEWNANEERSFKCFQSTSGFAGKTSRYYPSRLSCKVNTRPCIAVQNEKPEGRPCPQRRRP